MDNLEKPQKWIEIHDEEVTAETLMAKIETRVTQRQQTHQHTAPEFPVFGYAAPIPVPLSPQETPTLFHHLRQLNEMPAPETTAVLVPTSATQLPIVGRLWRLIRRQTHNLVLFYVNRALAHHSQTSHHTRSVLNELVRQNQQQRQHIEQLQAEVRRLQAQEEA